MPRRPEQLNELLKNELALLLARDLEVEGAMVTVTGVETAENRQSAHISVSVLPVSRSGSALAGLKRQSRQLAETLTRRLKLRKIPHLSWELDRGGEHSDEIEGILKTLEQQ